jgi:hypothetical protein
MGRGAEGNTGLNERHIDIVLLCIYYAHGYII